MKKVLQPYMNLGLFVYLLMSASVAMAGVVTDSGGGGTNPVTLTFILGVGIIFGGVMFFVFRNIRMIFFKKAVITDSMSPKESYDKYWGKSSITTFAILALFSALALCFLLIWIIERDTF